jgi:hypothetical protein
MNRLTTVVAALVLGPSLLLVSPAPGGAGWLHGHRHRCCVPCPPCCPFCEQTVQMCCDAKTGLWRLPQAGDDLTKCPMRPQSDLNKPCRYDGACPNEQMVQMCCDAKTGLWRPPQMGDNLANCPMRPQSDLNKPCKAPAGEPR